MPIRRATQRLTSRRQPPKRLAELGGEHGVTDWVDDAVCEEQHPREVHDVEVRLEAESLQVLPRPEHAPQSEGVHGQQTGEEEAHDRRQHHDDLLTCANRR